MPARVELAAEPAAAAAVAAIDARVAALFREQIAANNGFTAFEVSKTALPLGDFRAC